MAEMQDRIYDERSIKLYYIPRDVYYKNFKKDMTPPTLASTKLASPAPPTLPK